MGRKVVILGAGYAGVAAALYLNRKKKKDDIDITIIDRNPYHTLLTELHEVAGNRMDEESIRIPLKEIFRDTCVKVSTDEIKDFKFSDNYIEGREKYEYDYLVIAVGSSPAFYGIKGLEEYSYTLWSYNDAVKLRDHIRECFYIASQTKDEAERKRLLTFVVGGAGFTGVEMIGELAHWVKPLCREYGFSRGDVRLVIVDMLSKVLPVLDDKNSAKAHRYMQDKLGIEIHMETVVREMQQDRVITDKGEFETRTMIWTAGVCCSTSTDDADIEKTGGRQCLRVNDFCQTVYENVFGVGDCVCFLGGNDKPFPALVETALQTAEGAAENILRKIRGREMEKVEVKLHGVMVSIGNYFAVSDIMGKRLPSWLSMLMKYFVNVHYLHEIMGVRGPAKYLKDEIVHRKQDHTFLEKHYTRKMQAWWAVPIRMFLGFWWLYEGIEKVKQGWFESPKLAEFLGMSRGYTPVVDAVTSATAVGGLRIDKLFGLDLKIFNLIIGKATQLIEGNAISSDVFAKLEILHLENFNLVPWVIQGLALKTQGAEMFFQIAITILEIVVGLMLLGGFLTFIASVLSLALMAMFITSTGIYDYTWWMLFASITTAGGSGRAFGFDFWLIPYLSRVWESFWKNRSLKLSFRKRR